MRTFLLNRISFLALVFCFSGTALAVSVDAVDEQNYGYLLIEPVPAEFSSFTAGVKMRLNGVDLVAGVKSPRIANGEYCLNFTATFQIGDLSYCGIQINPTKTTSFNPWKKLSVLKITQLNVPAKTDDFSQNWNASFDGDIKWFDKLNDFQGEGIWIAPGAHPLEFSAPLENASGDITTVAGQVYELQVDIPDPTINVRVVPPTDGKLPLARAYEYKETRGNSGYYTKKNGFTQFVGDTNALLSVAGYDSYTSYGFAYLKGNTVQSLVADVPISQHSTALAQDLHIFPVEELNLTLNNMSLPVKFSGASPVTIQLQRIDVNDVKITQEDGIEVTKAGTYVVEYLDGKKWKAVEQAVYEPQLVYKTVRWNKTDKVVSSFKTGTGLDVLPGFRYRVTVNYNLDGASKQQIFAVNLK